MSNSTETAKGSTSDWIFSAAEYRPQRASQAEQTQVEERNQLRTEEASRSASQFTSIFSNDADPFSPSNGNGHQTFASVMPELSGAAKRDDASATAKREKVDWDSLPMAPAKREEKPAPLWSAEAATATKVYDFVPSATQELEPTPPIWSSLPDEPFVPAKPAVAKSAPAQPFEPLSVEKKPASTQPFEALPAAPKPAAAQSLDPLPPQRKLAPLPPLEPLPVLQKRMPAQSLEPLPVQQRSVSSASPSAQSFSARNTSAQPIPASASASQPVHKPVAASAATMRESQQLKEAMKEPATEQTSMELQAAPLGPLPSGIQRAVSAIRATLPYIHKILPLLDGNVGSAMVNMLSPQASAPSANLQHLEKALEDIKAQNRSLSQQLLEQGSNMRRIEDQLEAVRSAAERANSEQDELYEAVKAVGRRANLAITLALILLAAGIGANVYLYLQYHR